MSGVPAIRDVPGISAEEIDRLFQIMPGEEATRTMAFADALGVFARASDKAAAARVIAARFAPLGLKGLSLPSLYRKLADFRARRIWAPRSAQSISISRTPWGASSALRRV